MEKLEDNMTQENPKSFYIIERKITIDSTKIHLKSVFTNQIKLEDVLKNIVIRKMNYRFSPETD